MHVMLLVGFIILLSACQEKSTRVTILADGQTYSVNSIILVPRTLLDSAGITLGDDDRLLYLGAKIPLDADISVAKSITLQVRRAVTLTIKAPDGQKKVHTSALNVGQALTEAGYDLFSGDQIDPPGDTPIAGEMEISYIPGRDIVIIVDGTQVRTRSAAATVGQALAEAGVSLVGLDASQPVEVAPIPGDGQIHVVRVVESITLTQKSIPYNTRTEFSADLEIDHQALLQGGVPGLAVTRQRTRTEDGVQVSQQTEGESVVRPPQDRILGIGTKIVIRTTTLDGVTIEYWRALTLKATSYSPCRSADPQGRCLYGTSSGLPVKRGVVAMVYSWYLLFGFDHVYVPVYGEAVVGDVGGGWPNGNHYWVDLAWSEEEYQPMAYPDGVTVYFLTPVPKNPGYILP